MKGDIYKIYNPGHSHPDGSFTSGYYKFQVYVDNVFKEEFFHEDEAIQYCEEHVKEYTIHS